MNNNNTVILPEMVDSRPGLGVIRTFKTTFWKPLETCGLDLALSLGDVVSTSSLNHTNIICNCIYNIK